MEDELRAWLESVEAVLSGPEPALLEPALAYVAGRDLDLDEDELHGALRRAVLLLAAGGNPMRDIDPDGRAVSALADDLDAPEHRDALRRGLGRLREATNGLPRVRRRIALLERDSDRAWRWLAAALLAEDLAE